MAPKPRIVVISPFLDKRHGTERCVAEQLERLSSRYEIHLYSERVEDVDLRGIEWHRMRMPPGPHLFRYLWWFLANHFSRTWDRWMHGLVIELVYSPGVNCLDADLIAVHILFAKLRQELREELRFRNNPPAIWPVIVHRKIYYWFIEQLERRLYSRKAVTLVAVSRLVADDIAEFYGRTGNMTVVYHGVDPSRFSPARRCELRAGARAELVLPVDIFVLLLVGNDWKKKGLPCLLEAAGRLCDRRIRVLVVGRDIEAPYREITRRSGMEGQVMFLPLRPDVEIYYAASDVYAGPSLEDAFSLPPLEAMACGLPVITSRKAGVAELITHGRDGFVLEDPSDSKALAAIIKELATEPARCRRMGDAAAQTAAEYTWEHNAEQMRDLFERVRMQKQAGRSGAE